MLKKYKFDENINKIEKSKRIGKPYSQQKRQHGKGAGKVVDVHKRIEAELPGLQESYNKGYGKEMLERRLLVKYGGAFGADIDRLLKKVKGKKGSKQYTCDKCGEPTDKLYGGPGNDLCKECAKNAPKEPYKGYNRGALPPTGLTAKQEAQMLEEGLERAREEREPDIEPDFDAMKDDKE